MKNKLMIHIILVLSIFALGHAAERLVLNEYFTNAG
jgi:hypothetical protein